MLILFDLDDTLIETSKCITPYFLKQSFDAMVQAGLERGHDKKNFNELIAINKKALRLQDAIIEFCQLHSDQSKILMEGLTALSSPLPDDLEIEPVPYALETIHFFENECDLAVVSRGDFDLQIQKMEKAGIQPKRFSRIIVGKGLSKKFEYQRILNEFSISPQQCIVCGDRIPFDLTPAKELGIFTVHFRNGRGLFHQSPKKHVDITIDSLKELQEVFINYEG